MELVGDDVAALRAEVEKLAVTVNALAADREHYRELYLRALEQVRKLELGITGPKAERMASNDAQLTMGTCPLIRVQSL